MAKELSVIELVEAFNQARADLSAARENAALLEAEIRRLTPFEDEAAELREKLVSVEAISEERGLLGNKYGEERDEALKALDVAEAARSKANTAFEKAVDRARKAEAEVDAIKESLEQARGTIRELRAFEAKARPVFEAADALRAVLK